MSPLRVTERESTVRVTVRVQPRSSRAGVDGRHGDALEARVNSPPVDGVGAEAIHALGA